MLNRLKSSGNFAQGGRLPICLRKNYAEFCVWKGSVVALYYSLYYSSLNDVLQLNVFLREAGVFDRRSFVLPPSYSIGLPEHSHLCRNYDVFKVYNDQLTVTNFT